ncbi:MAG: cation diffusion facilitator family transporter [Bacteroidales bacterium]|jgi:cobalt-zinc-cadmium efflux system protein|nr:cation diffusion facilitator family transporter [Bacteroidales bacterium]MDD2264328.1 cation diffusion facilitator family transporter [Bacteroidales bacterium]MDD2831562.1 cation diffusion facilitator family transporter [Bacteroidales bacterium]MDD3208556.1 cation diffusion facilitator family transporter [Bacteroidales bacterium]MDD3697031.1 cation diffusion facilitator family transporter [Bacteroidales bacterium]
MHTHAQHCHHHYNSHTALHGKKLLWVTLLNFIITLAEIVGGLLSNSLSLLSDAVHNLGDSMALLFAWIANRLGNKKADKRRTFGYKRAEILTAFFNALVLIVICLFLFIEAYHRLREPKPIKGALMLTVAVIGLIANWVSVLILQKDKDRNINVKAAYLHLMGDTLSSVAVIIGGVVIWLWGVVWLDPVITVLVGIYIIYHTWSVLKQAIDILMQATPPHIDIDRLVSEIRNIPQVKDIHHLHVWQLNDDQIHFEAHINVAENIDMVQAAEMRGRIEACLQDHGISHSTLQIGYNCCKGHEQLIVDENL